MINRTKVKESTQIKPGDNGDVLVMKDNAPEWSTPSDAGLAEQANVDSELSKKQDKLVAGDNIYIDGNTISAASEPTPISIGTVTEGDTAMVSNSGTDTNVVLNFVMPKGVKGDQGPQGNPGTAATVTVGTTTTGEAGTEASVTNSGTTSAAVLDFVIPKGDKGDKGEKGDPGQAGTNINSIAPLTVSTTPFIAGSSALAIGNNAKALSADSIAIGNNAEASGSNTVSFGSVDITRRITNISDPQNAQDAATKNYVDTQLTPINAKLQYVPENTNQILSQIETNAEKAQSAAEAAQTTAESKANQTDLEALQTTVAGKADTSALANYATKTELSAKADQSAVDAKVSSVTAGTGISITGTATNPVINATGGDSYITKSSSLEEAYAIGDGAVSHRANEVTVGSVEPNGGFLQPGEFTRLIAGVSTPVNRYDAANKLYVDTQVQKVIAIPDYDNGQFITTATPESPFITPSTGVIYDVVASDVLPSMRATLKIRTPESSSSVPVASVANRFDTDKGVDITGVFPAQKGARAWVDGGANVHFRFAPYKFVEIS